jgi:hypothetical protein
MIDVAKIANNFSYIAIDYRTDRIFCDINYPFYIYLCFVTFHLVCVRPLDRTFYGSKEGIL